MRSDFLISAFLSALRPMRMASATALLLLPLARTTAQGLEVHFLDVGQGDATLVVGPTGKTLLIDAGNNGKGNNVVLPLFQSLGLSSLDFMVASHYHADHVGGLDEVANGGFLPGVAYDRGLVNPPGTVSYASYAAAVASVRQTIVPGQAIDLGGGASATCITVNGQVWSAGSVDISGSSSYENSASVGLLIQYGSFDLWVGGDLTGGTDGTTDVESVAAAVVGDIEVYQANHHGSKSSSNQNWANATKPDVTVFSAGAGNSYGHPHSFAINRLNSPSRSTVLQCTTAGTGNLGFVNAEGGIRVETDGTSYTVSPAAGPALAFLCDEVAGKAPAAGNLFVAEYLSRPTEAPSGLGQFFEIESIAPLPRSLRGLQVSSLDGQGFTFESALLLGPGEKLVLGIHGDRLTNGGFFASTVWPFGSFGLTAGSDSILLQEGATAVDSLVFTPSYPNPLGASVEKVDVPGASAAANFAASTSPFGLGDLGTPGAANSQDASDYPALIELTQTPTPGGLLSLAFCELEHGGMLYLSGLSYSATPGIDYLGFHIPLNFDPLLELSLYLPGFFGALSAVGTGQCAVAIPNSPTLVGFSGVAALVVLDPALQPLEVSAPIVWTIQ